MSSSTYVWIVLTSVSRIPVFVSTTKYEAYNWLARRRGVSMVRLYRMRGTRRIEVCLTCFMADPRATVHDISYREDNNGE